MALELWNELSVEKGEFSIEIEGEDADAASLPRDGSNLVVVGVETAFRSLDQPAPELSYRCANEIPYARGFGSSSAGIVGGLLAGFALAGVDADEATVLGLAADLDGHPDNVAPALKGGCCIGIHADSRWVTDRISLPEELKLVLYVPDEEGPTREARALLPAEVTRADAVFNVGRAAMLVNALSTGRLELLRYATDDRLHQPARSAVYPATSSIIRAALAGGAHGAFLSGAGPSIVALATGREMTVSYEMAEAARLHGLSGRVIVTEPSQRGAYVVEAK
jgi:homoserine kinase